MKPVSSLTAILICSVISSVGHAMGSEEARLLGFAQHQNNNKQFDKAREQGEKAFLEEEEQWELSRSRDLEAYRKVKKDRIMEDDGPEAKADDEERKVYQENYDKVRREYVDVKSKEKALERSAKGLPSEAQELGLDEIRPRYDYKKRAFFGGKPGGSKSGISSSRGSSSGSGFSGGSAPSFPPPPSFDDFDNGYVPAPNISPDDFGDVPPPPPPPAPIPGMYDPAFGADGVPVPPSPPFPEENDF